MSTQTEPAARAAREREYEAIQAQRREVDGELLVVRQHISREQDAIRDANRRLARQRRAEELLVEELQDLAERELHVSTRELVGRRA